MWRCAGIFVGPENMENGRKSDLEILEAGKVDENGSTSSINISVFDDFPMENPWIPLGSRLWRPARVVPLATWCCCHRRSATCEPKRVAGSRAGGSGGWGVVGAKKSTDLNGLSMKDLSMLIVYHIYIYVYTYIHINVYMICIYIYIMYIYIMYIYYIYIYYVYVLCLYIYYVYIYVYI